jgi:hypothetical protein
MFLNLCFFPRHCSIILCETLTQIYSSS